MPHHITLENEAAREAIALMGKEGFDGELMRSTMWAFRSFAQDDLSIGINVFVDAHLQWDNSPIDLTIMIAAVNKPLRRQTIVRLQHDIADRISRVVAEETGKKLRVEVHISLIGAIGTEYILQAASDQARLLSHNYLGTEHLLSALIRMSEADFPPVRLLGTLGLTPDSVTANIIEIVGEGSSSSQGDVPQTPRFKKVMRLAEEQAVLPNKTDAQHIFRGILAEGEGIAAQIIVKITRLNLYDIQTMCS